MPKTLHSSVNHREFPIGFSQAFILCFAYLAFLPICAFGQFDLEEPLRPHFNPEQIHAKQLRSAQVYSELDEDGIASHGGFGAKTQEIEFDAAGNVVYSITADNHGNYPFIDYGKGSVVQIDSFDLQRNKIRTYRETYQRKEEDVMSFDSQGHHTYLKSSVNDAQRVEIHFHWLNDQMVQAEIIQEESMHPTTVRTFDQKGRLIKQSNEISRVQSSYTEHNDTLITLSNLYMHDTLYSTSVFTMLVSSRRLCHFVQTDHKGRTKKEISIVYDNHGNATQYKKIEYPSRSRNPKDDPHILVVDIENNYADQLLLNRKYYSYKEGGEKILTRIDHFMYEQSPLVFKLKEGDQYEPEKYLDDY